MGIACDVPEHEKHLCQMVALEKPLDEMKPLVRNAKFICKFCARVANDKERLCKPMPID